MTEKHKFVIIHELLQARTEVSQQLMTEKQQLVAEKEQWTAEKQQLMTEKEHLQQELQIANATADEQVQQLRHQVSDIIVTIFNGNSCVICSYPVSCQP